MLLGSRVIAFRQCYTSRFLNSLFTISHSSLSSLTPSSSFRLSTLLKEIACEDDENGWPTDPAPSSLPSNPGVPRVIKARCSFRCRPKFDHTVRTANVDLTLSLGVTKMHPNEYDDYDTHSIGSGSSSGVSADSIANSNGSVDQSMSGQIGIIDSAVFHQAYGRTTTHSGAGADAVGYRFPGHSRNPSSGTQARKMETINRGASAAGGDGSGRTADSLSFEDMVQAGYRTQGQAVEQPESQPGSRVLVGGEPHQHLGTRGSRRGRGGRNVVMQRQRLRFMAATEITKVGDSARGISVTLNLCAATLL